MSEREKYLLPSEAARQLGISTRTLRRWLDAGKFPNAKMVPGRFGAEWRIPPGDIGPAAIVEPEIATGPELVRCEGVNKAGQHCGGIAVKGTRYCRHHQDQAKGNGDG